MVLGPLLPDHVLRLMSPADRKLLGKAGRTAAETLARAEAKSENELQEQIASMLKRREIVFIRPAMFRKSTLPPGWPDFTFAYRGIAIGWECKSVAGEPSDEQLRMHAHMEANGWRIDIIRSLHGVVEILNGIDLGDAFAHAKERETSNIVTSGLGHSGRSRRRPGRHDEKDTLAGPASK